MNITLRKDDGLWMVVVDDKSADNLTTDEALGAVASAMFLNRDRPIFLRTREEWDAIEHEFDKK